MATGVKKSWTSIGAILAAIGASVCCVGPLLLLSMGIGGAWVSTLTSFESVRPAFIILTIIFIGLGYRKLYLLHQKCDEDKQCTLPKIAKRQKTLILDRNYIHITFIGIPLVCPLFHGIKIKCCLLKRSFYY